MGNECIFKLAIVGALIYLMLKDKQGAPAGVGRVQRLTEPNFPTTAVAGSLGRGWQVYSQPAGTRYVKRVVLTT